VPTGEVIVARAHRLGDHSGIATIDWASTKHCMELKVRIVGNPGVGITVDGIMTTDVAKLQETASLVPFVPHLLPERSP
jgi:hypothetical protein